MGKECRKRIEEKYVLDVQARAYLDLYEGLVKTNGNPSKFDLLYQEKRLGNGA